MLRQYRYDCFYSWRVPEVIALLPVLMNTSLFLFLTGLTVFLFGIDRPLAVMVLILYVVLWMIYAASTVSPLIWPHSPLRSVLTGLIMATSVSVVRVLRLPQRMIPAHWNDDPWFAVPGRMAAQCLEHAALWLYRSQGPAMLTISMIEAFDALQVTLPSDPVALREISTSLSTAVDNARHQTEPRLPLYMRTARFWLLPDDLCHFVSKPELLSALQCIPLSDAELLSDAVVELAELLLAIADAESGLDCRQVVHQYLAGTSTSPTYLLSLFLNVLRDSNMRSDHSARIIRAILALQDIDPMNECWSFLAREVTKSCADGELQHLNTAVSR
ncbi:hypothetical protein EXIGLDRAFT_761353 [Exidia glandulosa HHB12029]|uniref:DUF6535 domain-containing protein n=1 Tax=Exidia glandulosa HHB12029 TaxID=1314781 RepID=A0A165NIL0_EXIGL|nr:hypothetical protein EXIGLDRAFT_761353 [Exidia glandulosa HHB12029]